MDQFLGLELTQEGFKLSTTGVIGEGGELKFGGGGVENADSEGRRRVRRRGMLLLESILVSSTWALSLPLFPSGRA